MCFLHYTGRGFYLAVGGAAAQHGYSHVMDVIQDKKLDCQLIDHSEDMVLISVQGPKRYVNSTTEIVQSLVIVVHAYEYRRCGQNNCI